MNLHSTIGANRSQKQIFPMHFFFPVSKEDAREYLTYTSSISLFITTGDEFERCIPSMISALNVALDYEVEMNIGHTKYIPLFAQDPYGPDDDDDDDDDDDEADDDDGGGDDDDDCTEEEDDGCS
jgi:hypothetical protein